MMELLAGLFVAGPYVIAGALGLGLAVLCVMCCASFGAGAAVIASAFALDVITQSSPLLNLGITLYVADLPMIFIGTVAGLRWILRKDIPRRHIGWVIFGMVFFVNLAIGLASHGTGAGVQARNDFYSLAAASYVMSFPIGPVQIRQLIAALAWLAFALLLLCVYRWTVYYGNVSELLPALGTYNIDGAIRVVSSNAALALAQALIIGMFFGFMGAGAKFARALLLALVGVVLVLQHRSVWLAGLVGVGVSMLLARSQSTSRLRQIVMLSAVVLAAGVGLTLGGKLTEDIQSSAARALEGQGTVAARFENWRVTIADWRDAGTRAILIGREFGSDSTRVVANALGENVRIRFGAHNIYVSLLTSTGVIGLSALLWMIFDTLRKLYAKSRSGREDAPYDAVLLVLVTTQLVYYVAYSTDFLQFMILGIAVAAANRAAAPAEGADPMSADKLGPFGLAGRRGMQPVPR